MTITQAAITLACVWAYFELMAIIKPLALQAIATFSIVSLLIYMLPAAGH